MAATVQPEVELSAQQNPAEETQPATAQETDYGPRNQNLPDRLYNQLHSLLLELERGDEISRRGEIRRVLQARLYWRSDQFWWWNSESFGRGDGLGTFFPSWVRPPGVSEDEFEMPAFQHVTNIYKAFGQSIGSVLTQNQVPARFWPQSPQQEVDVKTAKNATKVVDLIHRNNEMKTLAEDLAYFLWCDGVAAGHVRYALDGEKYGYDEEPEYSNELQPQIEAPERFACSTCERQYALDESAPLTARMGVCPDCGAEMSLLPAEVSYLPKQTGVRQVERGQEVIEIHGALNIRRSMWADKQCDLLYLEYVDELHLATAKNNWPWKGDSLATGYTSEGGTATMERTARRLLYSGTSSFSTGSDEQMGTMRRAWIRKRAFQQIADAEIRAELEQLFPNGCLVVFYGDEYCESKDESLDDAWRIIFADTGEGQSRRGLGDVVISPQDQLNDAVNLLFEQGMYGVPEGFVDENLLDFEARKTQGAKPGNLTPVSELRPGERIQDRLFFTPAIEPSVALDAYRKELFGPIVQFLVGAFPALFGGDSEGAAGDTAAGYAMARDQAMGRIGRVWRRMQEFWAQMDLLAVRCFADNRNKDVEKAVFGQGQDWESEWIRIDEMKGSLVAYPEVDAQYPVLQAQVSALISRLMGTDPTYQALVQASPEIMSESYRKLGLSEIADNLPGEAQRIKTHQDIQQLLKEQPQMQPVLDAAAPPMPMPSLVPDVEVEDLAIVEDVCRKWLISAEGTGAQKENPAGYANVRAYLMFAKQAQALKKMEQAQGILQVKQSQEPINPQEIGIEKGGERGSSQPASATA